MSADEEAGHQTCVRALTALPGISDVTLVSSRHLSARVGELKPDLIVLPLNGPADSLSAVNQLLDPGLSQRDIVAAVGEESAELVGVGVLDRLGVEWCVIRPVDASALRDTVRTWLAGKLSLRYQPHAPARLKQASGATVNVVASVIKAAPTALSAADVATKCGLSVVTCRRYLKRLVSEGRAAEKVHYRPVGRPISMYRWVT